MGGLHKPPPEEQGADWKRADGSQKGHGYLGLFDRRDDSGQKSSELSVGVQVDELNGGKQTEIPTMVPTLTENERNYLLDVPVDQHKQANPQLYDKIVGKAIDHALGRKASGKPIYAQPSESPKPAPRTLQPKPKLRDLDAIEQGLQQAEENK